MTKRKTILTGAPIWAGADGIRSDLSVGLVGDRIYRIGEHESVQMALGSDTPVRQIPGAILMPGFIDAHCHLLSLGEHLSTLDLTRCSSVDEMKERLAQRAAALPQGEWITGRGWDQNGFAEGRYPTRWDLDDAAPHHPVFLRRVCGHAAVANTRALQWAGIDETFSDSEAGYLERDDRGHPIGVLHEAAMRPVQAVIPEPDQRQKETFLQTAIRHCWANGLTSVQTNESSSDFWATWRAYRNVCAGDFPFRAYVDIPPDVAQAVRAQGFVTGSGDRWVRLGATKIFADGSLGARSAALSASYADTPSHRGVLLEPPNVLSEMMHDHHEAGMQLAVHAIGDRALDVVLDGIDGAIGRNPRPDPRHRIIHCQITRDAQFDRMAASGVIGSIQPIFVATDLNWAESRVGPALIRSSYAWKKMLEAGIPCAGGSDAPVEPINPLLGVWAAVCRQNDAGEPVGGWLPSERLTLQEALELFTLGSAQSEFSEGEKGIIREGALADLVVLDRDPFSVSNDDLRNLRVVETWVGGKRVWNQ